MLNVPTAVGPGIVSGMTPAYISRCTHVSPVTRIHRLQVDRTTAVGPTLRRRQTFMVSA